MQVLCKKSRSFIIALKSYRPTLRTLKVSLVCGKLACGFERKLRAILVKIKSTHTPREKNINICIGRQNGPVTCSKLTDCERFQSVQAGMVH